jgi:hypothetical protein
MKLLLSFAFTLLWACSFAQENSKAGRYGIGDSILKYFNYDTLRHVPCNKVPQGIYSLSFKVDKNRNVYDVVFSADTLIILKTLLTDALQAAIKHTAWKKTSKSFLQLVYYNNLLSCNNSSDPVFRHDDLDKMLLELRTRMLSSTEKTFMNVVQKEKEYIVLKPVMIGNENPFKPEGQKKFLNDHRKGNESELNPETLEKLKKKD